MEEKKMKIFNQEIEFEQSKLHCVVDGNPIELDIEDFASKYMNMKHDAGAAIKKITGLEFKLKQAYVCIGDLRESLRVKEERIQQALKEKSHMKEEMQKEIDRLNSPNVHKIRMAAYNQAKAWNESVSKKFDCMINNAKKGNIFERVIMWRIWKKMKAAWDSEKIKKNY